MKHHEECFLHPCHPADTLLHDPTVINEDGARGRSYERRPRVRMFHGAHKPTRDQLSDVLEDFTRTHLPKRRLLNTPQSPP